MTVKGRELGDVIERRKLNVLYVQETKWKGNLKKKKQHLDPGSHLVNPGGHSFFSIIREVFLWKERGVFLYTG